MKNEDQLIGRILIYYTNGISLFICLKKIKKNYE